MGPDPELVATAATINAALLMIVAGMHRRLLQWRTHRTCVACGAPVDRCRCR
jgi:hypothetical protein